MHQYFFLQFDYNFIWNNCKYLFYMLSFVAYQQNKIIKTFYDKFYNTDNLSTLSLTINIIFLHKKLFCFKFKNQKNIFFLLIFKIICRKILFLYKILSKWSNILSNFFLFLPFVFLFQRLFFLINLLMIEHFTMLWF